MKEIEVIKKIEQKELVLIEFREERVRETHYDGKNVLTRLAINIKYDSDRKRDEIVSLLKEIDIRPEFIIINQQEREISVWWFSQQNNVIFNEKNYLRLIDEFIDYVISLRLDNWNIEIGMLDDDPIEVDLQENENLDVVINPKFTKRNFGLNGESQIHFE
ncbi:hypothetical protein ACSXBY_00155 [Clostridium perfringens]|jgi:hypothetical protein|uniref:hypothetical protein n=1 Tax=Clostridium TaxID=1485 RepID=UPI0024BC3E2E|nr:hypothetical protein [Clostridium perfringens]